MAKFLAALGLLLYATNVQTASNETYVICSCGDPAYLIHQGENKWTLFGYDPDKFSNEHNAMLFWLCRQKLAQVNSFHILKTENYTTHKCPIRI